MNFPAILPYPAILDVKDVPELATKFCYVFKDYGNSGLTLVIKREAGSVYLKLADWSGKEMKPETVSKDVSQIMTEQSHRIILTMKLIGIPQAIFYFSSNSLLVDMRLSMNKFCGPGYLGDFFGKQGIPMQERVGEPVFLKSEELGKIRQGQGVYKGQKGFILKPSAFKFMVRNDVILPVYGRVTCETNTTS